MEPPELDLSKLDAIIDRHRSGKWELIHSFVAEPAKCRANGLSA